MKEHVLPPVSYIIVCFMSSVVLPRAWLDCADGSTDSSPRLYSHDEATETEAFGEAVGGPL